MTGVSQTSSLAECLTSDSLKDPITGINSTGSRSQNQRLLNPKGARRLCRRTSRWCILQRSKLRMCTLVVTTAYMVSCNHLCYNTWLLVRRWIDPSVLWKVPYFPYACIAKNVSSHLLAWSCLHTSETYLAGQWHRCSRAAPRFGRAHRWSQEGKKGPCYRVCCDRWGPALQARRCQGG